MEHDKGSKGHYNMMKRQNGGGKSKGEPFEGRGGSGMN